MLIINFTLWWQLDGRVKTLHPSIHGGILARRDQRHHMDALKKHGIGEFYACVLFTYCIFAINLRNSYVGPKF